MSATIYLDVDGVINAVSKNNPSHNITGWRDWSEKKVAGFRILYSLELVAEINRLAATPDVTIRWLTTWEDHAATELSPALGIHGTEWAVLHGDHHAWHGIDWWKLKAIRDDAGNSDGKVIWIDDDISSEPEATKWASQADVLVISPNTTHGLTRSHINKINAFINNESEQAA